MKILLNKLFLCLCFVFLLTTAGFSQTFDPLVCYQIVNKISNKALEVKNNSQANGAQIYQWSVTGLGNQLWKMEKRPDGSYNIVSQSSGKLIDAKACDEGTIIKQYAADGTNSQNWRLLPQSDGSIKILNVACNKYLRLAGGNTADGNPVGIRTDFGTDAFKWFIQETTCTSIPPPTLNLDPNKCYIINSAWPIAHLGVQNKSTSNGAFVNTSRFMGGLNEIWSVRKLSDGTYNIYSKNTGKVLDVDNSAGCPNGLRAIQYALDGTSSQKWRLELVPGFGDGTFVQITNVSCNKRLKTQGLAQTGFDQIVELNGGTSVEPRNFYWYFTEISCQTPCNVPGSLLVETWNNQTSTNFPLVVPTSAPNSVTRIANTNPPTVSGSNYLQRIKGYFLPRISGQYSFNLTTTDVAEFFISPTVNPSEKVRVAYVQTPSSTTNSTSNPIQLNFNNLYYFEVLYKVGTNVNSRWNLIWKKPTFTTFSALPLDVLNGPCTNAVQGLSTAQSLTFEAQAVEGRAKLQWITKGMDNIDYFAIERMDEKGNFDVLDKQNGYPNSTELQSYTFTDNNSLEGDNFYRIATYSNLAPPQYSEVKKVSFAKTTDIGLFPNPASDYIDLDLRQYEGKAVSLSFYNSVGTFVQNIKIAKAVSAPQRIDIQGFNTGAYLIRLQVEGKKEITKLFNVVK
jgi:Ricin-type beta-trefoil lectin domain-like/Secretion system C-terminal sorting domain